MAMRGRRTTWLKRLGLVALAVVAGTSGCATADAPAEVNNAPVSYKEPARKVEAKQAERPELAEALQAVPWRSVRLGNGAWDVEHVAAGVFLPYRAGAFERFDAQVYDAINNDAGFHYRLAASPGGAAPPAAPTPACNLALSVYVYPASEPLAVHLRRAEDSLQREVSGAQPVADVVAVDVHLHDGGLQSMFQVEKGGLLVHEQVAVFERNGWSTKFRLTLSPAREAACEKIMAAALPAFRAP